MVACDLFGAAFAIVVVLVVVGVVMLFVLVLLAIAVIVAGLLRVVMSSFVVGCLFNMYDVVDFVGGFV